jgi:hypothetical protein
MRVLAAGDLDSDGDRAVDVDDAELGAAGSVLAAGMAWAATAGSGGTEVVAELVILLVMFKLVSGIESG